MSGADDLHSAFRRAWGLLAVAHLSERDNTEVPAETLQEFREALGETIKACEAMLLKLAGGARSADALEQAWRDQIVADLERALYEPEVQQPLEDAEPNLDDSHDREI